jgi:large subunit ribosomal protein L19
MTNSDETNAGENNSVETGAAEATMATEAAAPRATKRETTSLAQALSAVASPLVRTDLPKFNTGDTVRVHAKIIEGAKERVQVFEGIVLKRSKGNLPDASFTVRKVSYNIGVERTFPLHSPRIEKIELITRAKVRRSRLFYLRPLRGKATRMKTVFNSSKESPTQAA